MATTSWLARIRCCWPISDNAAMKTLRLATRESALALWQTEHVAARLRVHHPGLDIQLVAISGVLSRRSAP